MVHAQQNFYFDGHVRYRKSKDIMMTALKNGIRRDRHTTYLCPLRDLNPVVIFRLTSSSNATTSSGISPQSMLSFNSIFSASPSSAS